MAQLDFDVAARSLFNGMDLENPVHFHGKAQSHGFLGRKLREDDFRKERVLLGNNRLSLINSKEHLDLVRGAALDCDGAVDRERGAFGEERDKGAGSSGNTN